MQFTISLNCDVISLSETAPRARRPPSKQSSFGEAWNNLEQAVHENIKKKILDPDGDPVANSL